jgi:hypothetical protein
VRVRSVDPRDIGWEDDEPAFRVTFWKELPSPVDGGRVSVGYQSREYEVSDAEVGEVIAWATREAEVAETWTLHVLAREARMATWGRFVSQELTPIGRGPRSAEDPAFICGACAR